MPLHNVFGELALDATVAERYGGGKIPVTATITDIGDTVIYTPAAGKRVKVYWVTAVQDPSTSAQPLIVVKFVGGSELYRNFVIGHWETFVGGVNQALAVNLDQAGRVAVTVHLQEIT